MTNKILKATSKIVLVCMILAFTTASCNGKSGDADKKASGTDTTKKMEPTAPPTNDSGGKKKDSLSDKPTAPADKMAPNP